METRKITIVSTKNQSKKVIMSAATTLAELKKDLRENNIEYDNMIFFEGISKVELKTDDSILPHDVPWKGNITNELVFMLTNVKKKIRSGAPTRIEAYNKIKKLNLQSECLKRFGKHYTTCKTADLLKLIDLHENTNIQQEPDHSTTQVVEAKKEEVPVKVENFEDKVARAAIRQLTDLLVEVGSIEDYEGSKILDILGECTNFISDDSGIESSYSDNDINDMFKGIN